MHRDSHVFTSPIGAIFLEGEGERLSSVRIAPEARPVRSSPGPLLAEAERQIAAYFGGRLRDFDLPLAPASTARGEELRQAILAIAHGETASYGEIAGRAESGPRAIGQACRRNPMPIVVPCHRVVGAGGSIGYYSGGAGVTTKAWLLNHESKEGAKWAA